MWIIIHISKIIQIIFQYFVIYLYIFNIVIWLRCTLVLLIDQNEYKGHINGYIFFCYLTEKCIDVLLIKSLCILSISQIFITLICQSFFTSDSFFFMERCSFLHERGTITLKSSPSFSSKKCSKTYCNGINQIRDLCNFLTQINSSTMYTQAQFIFK